jgi:hypothetical protein
MIRKHPNVSDANFDILIDIAIKDAELTGYVKRHAQAILQFVFLGLHPGEHLWSIQQNTKLESFFGLICFDSRENQCALRYCFTKAKQSDKP